MSNRVQNFNNYISKYENQTYEELQQKISDDLQTKLQARSQDFLKAHNVSGDLQEVGIGLLNAPDIYKKGVQGLGQAREGLGKLEDRLLAVPEQLGDLKQKALDLGEKVQQKVGDVKDAVKQQVENISDKVKDFKAPKMAGSKVYPVQNQAPLQNDMPPQPASSLSQPKNNTQDRVDDFDRDIQSDIKTTQASNKAQMDKFNEAKSKVIGEGEGELAGEEEATGEATEAAEEGTGGALSEFLLPAAGLALVGESIFNIFKPHHDAKLPQAPTPQDLLPPDYNVRKQYLSGFNQNLGRTISSTGASF